MEQQEKKKGFRKLEERLLNQLGFYRSNYLKYWVIAAIDVVIATFCSVFVFLIYAPIEGPFSRRNVLIVIVLAVIINMISFYLFKTYRNIIRYTTVKGLLPLGYSVAVKSVILTVVLYFAGLLSPGIELRFLLIDLLFTFVALVSIRVLMIIAYDMVNEKFNINSQRVLIYGIDEKAASILIRLHKSKHYKPIGFLVHEHGKRAYRLNEMKVYHFQTREDVVKLVHKLGAKAILFPSYRGIHAEKNRLIHYCNLEKINIIMVPPIDELGSKDTIQLNIRPIAIEDILGREEITINMDVVSERFRDKTIFVSGAAGSIGSEFCRQVAGLNVVKQLILMDMAETPMHELRLELEEKYPNLNFVHFIGDVRHKATIHDLLATYKPQIVFHAAAYKHVPLMEENPCEAVRVNVEGTRIMADAAVAHGVEKFIFLSSDKAVNPTNVMGATKRLAEMYVQSLGLAISHGKVEGTTQFVTTRFGNVLGSNGSVIPRFRQQITNGGPLTLTHKDITRFFMSISEACRLIMKAATISTNNEIMVFDMGEPVLIKDMAERMIHLAGFTPYDEIDIREVGLRPGEKLYEEVLSTQENSAPTSHPKIRVAAVRANNYQELRDALQQISRRAWERDVPATVQLLKKWVPEFKSHNSQFEKYDVD